MVSPISECLQILVDDRIVGYSHKDCRLDDGDDGKQPCHGSP